jgi:hypothetical protein
MLNDPGCWTTCSVYKWRHCLTANHPSSLSATQTLYPDYLQTQTQHNPAIRLTVLHYCTSGLTSLTLTPIAHPQCLALQLIEKGVVLRNLASSKLVLGVIRRRPLLVSHVLPYLGKQS